MLLQGRDRFIPKNANVTLGDHFAQFIHQQPIPAVMSPSVMVVKTGSIASEDQKMKCQNLRNIWLTDEKSELANNSHHSKRTNIFCVSRGVMHYLLQTGRYREYFCREMSRYFALEQGREQDLKHELKHELKQGYDSPTLLLC